MSITTAVRSTDLGGLVDLLREQHVRKIDMVVPATTMLAAWGDIVISNVDQILEADGVTDPNGRYHPTRVFDEGISDKLGIPLAYVRRLREQRLDLWDANVNGWLLGDVGDSIPGDPRSFLFRAFRGDDGGDGIARALLSDRFAIVDNLDVLLAVLDGINQAGITAVVDRASLTERRMSVDIVAPEIQVMAEALLKGYRNPFGEDFERWRGVADREGLGYGGEEPVIWAGLHVGNSETGDGAFTITPKAKIKVCANGLVLTKDMVRSVHLGGKLDHGVVNWSAETQEKNVELIKAKTIDSVTTFLNLDYLTNAIDGLTKAGEKPVSDHEEVKVIAKRAKYTDAQTAEILAMFTRGGQMTRAGVMNAATAAAQMSPDADEAYDMEQRAVSLLTV